MKKHYLNSLRFFRSRANIKKPLVLWSSSWYKWPALIYKIKTIKFSRSWYSNLVLSYLKTYFSQKNGHLDLGNLEKFDILVNFIIEEFEFLQICSGFFLVRKNLRRLRDFFFHKIPTWVWGCCWGCWRLVTLTSEASVKFFSSSLLLFSITTNVLS